LKHPANGKCAHVYVTDRLIARKCRSRADLRRRNHTVDPLIRKRATSDHGHFIENQKHGDVMRFLATISNCAAGLTPALLALALLPLSTDIVRSDPSEPDASAPEASSACGAHEVVYHSEPSSGSEPGCGNSSRTPAEIAEARAYVVETATPGYTMTRQGADLATERLHPEFVVRLANAIREARNAGLPFAGVFSAYRPPAFGVGGFSDKFNSLHTYGLAVDMNGIGRPGSAEARLWHEIAARNGVVCPYGPRHQAEWNHCQPTRLKIVLAANPLRDTVTAAGPSDLEDMFEAGNRMIESMASAADSLGRGEAAPARKLETAAKSHESRAEAAAERKTRRNGRHAKVAARAGKGGKPVADLEGGRRKSKSGRG
jgi:hypothetical protein